MTQKSVSAVKSQLETLQDAESELAENFKSDLTNLHETFVKEAQTMLEKMRSSLHIFGALVKEPDRAKLQNDLNEEIADASLDDFFRKSGNLKRELEKIRDAIGSPELIYEKLLSDLRSRLRVVLGCLGVEEVLERDGKVANKKACENKIFRHFCTIRTNISTCTLSQRLRNTCAFRLDSVQGGSYSHSRN